MDKYCNDFMTVINSIEHDNTYKLAWARAIIEAIVANEFEIEADSEMIFISEYILAQKIMKYYWNLIGFFGLSQGPSKILDGRIEEIKEGFYKSSSITYPVWYDKIEAFLTRNPIRMERQIKKFITFVNSGVANKFEKIHRDRLALYDLDIKNRRLHFTKDNIESLTNNQEVLSNLIDYKWATLLEEYNKSPNLIKKVCGSKDNKLTRKGHTKFRNLILQYTHFDGLTDFYTGEHLSVEDAVLDHVIPYYFIYSTDLWNVVITSKTNAKLKRGMIPSKEEITKLKTRNKEILESMGNTKQHVRFELENAQQYDLLHRYSTDLNGSFSTE